MGQIYMILINGQNNESSHLLLSLTSMLQHSTQRKFIKIYWAFKFVQLQVHSIENSLPRNCVIVMIKAVADEAVCSNPSTSKSSKMFPLTNSQARNCFSGGMELKSKLLWHLHLVPWNEKCTVSDIRLTNKMIWKN